MSALSDRLRDAAGSKTYDEIVELTEQVGMALGKGTVHRLLTGTHGRVKQATLAAIAKALGLDERELRVLADRPAGDLGLYIPTENARSLTKKQRDAIDQMIDAFVGGDIGGLAAPAEKSPDGPSGTPDELAARRAAERDAKWKAENPGMSTEAARTSKRRRPPRDETPDEGV